MGNKDITLGVRISEDIRQELDLAAEALDVPTSQIVREAVREKLAVLKQTHPLLKQQIDSAVATTSIS